ncbi:DUF2288 family protein [filamentous cyanobacterium LEGE 11480]|uniref:DUF2288 family protein n=1 Tax=Romeriopsis navalis LEGE 11480 TaxID=2777977 RepID=A0A928VLM4_9CYAN|nr:DUF2288 domain-containing protein [Romeriopsis navalis]MBE9028274.1 DUF2288 family protein [Romeriopsis navalis LEGE 11480]
MSDLRQDLTELLDEATWEWLVPHAERDAVIIVDDGLDLVEVGLAIAQDQTQPVNHWIAEQLLVKPTMEQKIVWEKADQTRFSALIVQPYVLIQALVEDPGIQPA